MVAVWLWVGLAVLAAAIVYLFEWRPRPDTSYRGSADGSRTAPAPAYRHDREMLEAPAEDEPVEALSHEEYDPVGTAIIVAAYFLVVSGLWLFMYFVEFLGGGPTVVG
jgi:hypothetical protein